MLWAVDKTRVGDYEVAARASFCALIPNAGVMSCLKEMLCLK